MISHDSITLTLICTREHSTAFPRAVCSAHITQLQQTDKKTASSRTVRYRKHCVQPQPRSPQAHVIVCVDTHTQALSVLVVCASSLGTLRFPPASACGFHPSRALPEWEPPCRRRRGASPSPFSPPPRPHLSCTITPPPRPPPPTCPSAPLRFRSARHPAISTRITTARRAPCIRTASTWAPTR